MRRTKPVCSRSAAHRGRRARRSGAPHRLRRLRRPTAATAATRLPQRAVRHVTSARHLPPVAEGRAALHLPDVPLHAPAHTELRQPLSVLAAAPPIMLPRILHAATAATIERMEEKPASRDGSGLPFSMAALGPSVENLLQHPRGSTEAPPTVAHGSASITSSQEQQLGGDSSSHPPLSQLASELASGQGDSAHGATNGSATCSDGGAWPQKAVQWQLPAGTAGAGSGAKQTCSSALNSSCIPAFHEHETIGSDCVTSQECSAPPLGCMPHPDDSLPVLMPTLRSAFSPHDASPGHLHPCLRESSSCGVLQDVHTDAEDDEDHPRVQEAESSPARLSLIHI